MSEAQTQIAIVQYLRLALPECLIHHSPNEQPSSAANRGLAAARMNKAKKMGMVPGFPDLVVFPRVQDGPAMFFEVKAGENNTTEAQNQIHQWLVDLGYWFAVVRSVDDVRHALREWGVDTREVTI